MNFAAVTVTEANGSLIAEKLRLAHQAAGRDRAAPARPYRPRGHARRAPGGLTVAGAAISTAVASMLLIEVVEQLGSEILLDMKVGEGCHGGERRATARVKVRDQLRIAMRPSRLHVSTPN